MQILESVVSDFKAELQTITKTPDLLNLKAKFLGKQGPISEVMKNLKDATVEEKRLIGARANEVKTAIEELFSAKLQEIELKEINEKLNKDKIDISLTDSVLDLGLQAAGFHPVTTIQQEIEDIFISMGFEVLDGPHIEDEFHNFEALNIPATHPARDMQDTFYISQNPDWLLRTHTSSVQIREMEKCKLPIRMLMPGRVSMRRKLSMFSSPFIRLIARVRAWVWPSAAKSCNRSPARST